MKLIYRKLTGIKYYIVLFLSILAVSTYSCSSGDDDIVPPPDDDDELPKVEVNIPSAKGITDLALIYHTYVSRPKWTSGQIKHYIFRENNNKIEWLFDGFLFLEIYAKVNGTEYDYGIPTYGRGSPTKSVWEYLLSETFADKRGPNALEIVLDSLAQKEHIPPYKRQVVFGIPNPHYGQKDWGLLNGKALNFNKPEDRLTAACWYVDRVLEEWKKRDYKHLDFAGFYWLHETIDGAPNNDEDLIKAVAEYLKTKNTDLCWIPYYGAAGANRWGDFGFNIAYQQPNYFFDTNSPITILTGALDYAKRYNLALEMEFDDRVSQPAYMERYYTYIDEFEKAGVWNEKPVAYYDGGGAWYRMSISKISTMKEMHKALSDILVKRNRKFSTIIDKK
ncbi:MAG: DUF4855 domain-containing protein [Prevotella sp.]|jgi:hypothetical protein|nr:DUF4855 domain-containing protein [Prevotella sp.]